MRLSRQVACSQQKLPSVSIRRCLSVVFPASVLNAHLRRPSAIPEVEFLRLPHLPSNCLWRQRCAAARSTSDLQA